MPTRGGLNPFLVELHLQYIRVAKWGSPSALFKFIAQGRNAKASELLSLE
jgi:hypothetical protein